MLHINGNSLQYHATVETTAIMIITYLTVTLTTAETVSPAPMQ